MKRFILCLLIAVSAVCVAFAVAACAPDMSMHNYSSDWSCDEDTHFHRCTDSGCHKTDEPLAHDWVLIPGTTVREPTCGIPGYGEFKCSVCGATIDKEIPATEEHNWENVEKECLEPTCGEDGFTTRQCKDCKKREQVTVPATGVHQFGDEWYDSESGVIGGEGYHYQKCIYCGVNGESEAHTAGEAVTVDADNEKLTDGSKTYSCTKCNHIMEQETIYAQGVPVSFELEIYKNSTKMETVNDELGTRISVSGGSYRLEYVNLKDREGNSILALPSAVSVRVTFMGTDEYELSLDTEPWFNLNVLTINKQNYPSENGSYLLVELLTGEEDDITVRASRRLYVTLT